MSTISQVVSDMILALNNNVAKNKGITGVFQFCLGGDDNLDFYVTFVDGVPKLDDGIAEASDVTVSMAADDFKDMMSGKLSATSAFMGGRLRIKGDMGLAIKLQSMLS